MFKQPAGSAGKITVVLEQDFGVDHIEELDVPAGKTLIEI
jgi:hypothetical protein